MKTLNPDSGFQSYQKVFQQLKSSRSPLIVWQVFPENSKRVVNETSLTSYDLDTQLLHLSSVNDFLDPSLPLYCFGKHQNFIFKCSIKQVKDDSFTTVFPNEIRMLEEPDYQLIKGSTGLDLNQLWIASSHYKEQDPGVWKVKSMAQRSTRDQDFLNLEFGSLSLDEEDKIFQDKRESPRVRPKKQKLVKVIKQGESEMNFFDLFDLSRGGMSFLTSYPDQFPKGCEILVTGFDAYDLDDPLVGTVMSHRTVDGSVDVKVGIKFKEGQA